VRHHKDPAQAPRRKAQVRTARRKSRVRMQRHRDRIRALPRKDLPRAPRRKVPAPKQRHKDPDLMRRSKDRDRDQHRVDLAKEANHARADWRSRRLSSRLLPSQIRMRPTGSNATGLPEPPLGLTLDCGPGQDSKRLPVVGLCDE
jgi:hypothetical protein